MDQNTRFLTETVLRISGVDPKKCMKCGKCSGTCPNYDAMEYHPHQFVSMVENGLIEELMDSNAVYLCLGCMACVERCPRHVAPGKLVGALAQLKLRKQDGNHKGGNDIAAMADEKVPQQLLMAAMRKYRK
ncbi:MAG: 4Fe-4S dicluster domain-containing protein [Clostridia bacterium]|nr:4Fe-4S dicluster domain-containing protein [Clostridia bacterium]